MGINVKNSEKKKPAGTKTGPLLLARRGTVVEGSKHSMGNSEEEADEMLQDATLGTQSPQSGLCFCFSSYPCSFPIKKEDQQIHS